MKREAGWAWLFPATFAVHIVEEYWRPGGFPEWLSRLLGTQSSPRVVTAFLVVNAVAWTLMCIAVVIVYARNALWPVTVLGTVVLVNGSLHGLGTLVTRSYSPGTFSGILLFLPLGASSLFVCRRRLSDSSFLRGILAGVAIHGIISSIAFRILR